MKTIFDHNERVKGKPHHIRKRVAFASAAIATILIAVVWFVGSVSSGAFSIQGSSFSSIAGQGGGVNSSNGAQGNQNLAGVGAASTISQSPDIPAHIEIIDAPSTAARKQTEQTTLPF